MKTGSTGGATGAPSDVCRGIAPSDTDATTNEEECRKEKERDAHEMSTNAMPRNAMPRNAMPRNAMPRNALSVGALSSNSAILAAVAKAPLDDATLALPAVKQLLETNSDDAQALLSYIVSCALDPEVTVGEQIRSTAAYPFKPPWRGQLGLCGRQSESDWSKMPPGEHCMELVTACLLARTNAGGKRVVISARGEPECSFPMRDRVPVVEEYRESFGTPIASFGAKCPAGAGPVESQDCGWAPAYVGRCISAPGGERQVTMRVGPATEGGRIDAVRVCSGIHGCDAKGPSPLVAAAHYSQPLKSVACAQDGDCDVTFECPPNGPFVGFDPTKPPPSPPPSPNAPVYGYFSLMYRGASPRVSVRQRGAKVDYPATEAQVFMYPEGAFYGNIFGDPCAPRGRRGEPSKILEGQMYACHSDLWADGLAHLADRLCVVPPQQTPIPAQCFGNVPRPCGPARKGVCAEMDPYPDDGDFDACAGSAEDRPWRHPITVYLNHPCDLTAAPGSCQVRDGYAPGAR